MTKHWTAADIADQTGRVVLVTGANAGLGFAIAKDLAYRGARVLLACRNLAKAEAAVASIRGGLPMANIEIVELDLASLASVGVAARAVHASEPRLDLLINNAGLMALDESRTEEGFEMQFGVNHLGHFAFTADLLPLLLQTPDSRIVTMSSQGHRAGRINFDDPNFKRRTYRRWPAYFQSKLANILFTAELDRRLRATNSTTAALAAHPGGSRTDLGTEGRGLSNRLFNMTMIGQSAEAGALPTLRAATDPSAVGGQYYGPRWGMWGRAVLETPSKRARNADDAARLWTRSEELTARLGVLSLP
jgi:NAD(P)-dependent dehydrogenase (short-subunit alcohol dehydrogenase family)